MASDEHSGDGQSRIVDSIDVRMLERMLEHLSGDEHPERVFDCERRFREALEGEIALVEHTFLAKEAQYHHVYHEVLVPLARGKKQAVTLVRGGTGGLGIRFIKDEAFTQLFCIADLLPGGSAAASGLLQPGDLILRVDQRDVARMTLEEGIMAIKGAAGTPVTLYISRTGVLGGDEASEYDKAAAASGDLMSFGSDAGTAPQPRLQAPPVPPDSPPLDAFGFSEVGFALDMPNEDDSGDSGGVLLEALPGVQHQEADSFHRRGGLLEAGPANDDRWEEARSPQARVATAGHTDINSSEAAKGESPRGFCMHAALASSRDKIAALQRYARSNLITVVQIVKKHDALVRVHSAEKYAQTLQEAPAQELSANVVALLCGMKFVTHKRLNEVSEGIRALLSALERSPNGVGSGDDGGKNVMEPTERSRPDIDMILDSLQQAALDNTVVRQPGEVRKQGGNPVGSVGLGQAGAFAVSGSEAVPLSEGIVAKSPMEQGGLWPSAVVSSVLSADDAATEGSMRAGHAWDDESDINREGACIQCDAVVHHSHLSQYCSQCQGLLCETCAVSHGRMKVFRHHQIRVLMPVKSVHQMMGTAEVSRAGWQRGLDARKEYPTRPLHSRNPSLSSLPEEVTRKRNTPEPSLCDEEEAMAAASASGTASASALSLPSDGSLRGGGGGIFEGGIPPLQHFRGWNSSLKVPLPSALTIPKLPSLPRMPMHAPMQAAAAGKQRLQAMSSMHVPMHAAAAAQSKLSKLFSGGLSNQGQHENTKAGDGIILQQQQVQQKKQRVKVGARGACLACKASHIGCDEGDPCGNCVRRGRKCERLRQKPAGSPLDLADLSTLAECNTVDPECALNDFRI